MTGPLRPRIRDDLAMMAGYHSPQVEVDIRLNTNESPVPPPDAFHDALAAETSRVDWHRYPDRAATGLIDGLAEHHSVDPSMVFAANGSNEVLQSVMLAYGGPGRSALTFEPTYALHSHISRVTGTAVVEVERDADFRIDPQQAVDAVHQHRPSVVFLCSPNNPTGMVETKELVQLVLAAAHEVGALLVVDEAYGQFAEWSALELVSDDASLVVTQTFSKTWSMAAARLGYLVGPTWVIEDLHQVILPYHLDAVKQLAGTVALRYADEMADRISMLVAERQRVEAALAKLPVTVWPSGANFILFRPSSESGAGLDGQAVWQALLDRSILVRNCASWPRLDGCLRVTLGTPQENTAFLAALGEILD